MPALIAKPDRQTHTVDVDADTDAAATTRANDIFVFFVFFFLPFLLSSSSSHRRLGSRSRRCSELPPVGYARRQTPPGKPSSKYHEVILSCLSPSGCLSELLAVLLSLRCALLVCSACFSLLHPAALLCRVCLGPPSWVFPVPVPLFSALPAINHPSTPSDTDINSPQPL